MVKRQLVCNVFHNVASDDFYIGTASAIYCATGFPLPLNRNQKWVRCWESAKIP